MIMVGNERVPVDLQVISVHDPLQQGQKTQTVLVIHENGTVPGPPVHDVVPCPGVVNSRLSTHSQKVVKSGLSVKWRCLTPPLVENHKPL